MQTKINYQLMLDRELESIKSSGRVPRLLLHSCCAPCSSYTLEYLSEYFEITVFYYNPNICPTEEFHRRAAEQQRLISLLPVKHPVSLIVADYDPQEFYDAVKGLEDIPEGGERCFACYRLRLEKAAALAAEQGFEYFTTTLSISPHKNAQKLNEIASDLSGIYKVKALPADLKKRGGYKRSIELSHTYGLYRQDYCGCIFSQREAARRYKIRPLDKTEYPLLDDFLYEAIFIPEGVEAPPRDIILRPELQVYVEDFGTRRGDYALAAEIQGKVVGAVWVRIMEDYGHIDDNTPSFAISLYPEYRGRGIGTALMKAMLVLLRREGYPCASLAVQKANYAVKMYRKVGFETVSENEEEYIMLCRLG